MTTDADGFFLNPTTGGVQGSFAPFDPPTETRSFTIRLNARDKSGAERLVEDIVMQVRYEDTAVPASHSMVPSPAIVKASIEATSARHPLPRKVRRLWPIKKSKPQSSQLLPAASSG